ncbi:hypothetical protein PISL3812_01806 [Talaromyces islandicus]|uniref:non-specific serine/threonine protein kinase n=1 Tax=Talaromyces islandicus TaxID=28573 RepID=A0A0U1LN44_TALIS|nr:hypothetical protein PISL3812_01806 [Talaromyces islandicus]
MCNDSRKMPTRRTAASRFRLFTSSKTVADDGPGEDTSSTTRSAAEEQAHEKRNRSRLRLQFRRSRVKVLSKLGLWSSETSALVLKDTGETNILASTTALDRKSTEQRSYFQLDGTSSIEHERNSNVLSAPCTLLGDLYACETAETLSNDNDSIESKDDGICVPQALPPRYPRKFSIFAPCTVIHRRKTRPRAWISTTDGPHPVISFSRSDNITQANTDQSTCISPVFSQTSCSSSLDGVSASILLTTSESPVGVQVPRFLSSQCFSSAQSAPQFKLQSSIVTVEAAAAAKIFLETHFNTILSGRDARGQRLRELQEHLGTLPFTHEERKGAKQAWAAQETEYLRRIRVLKSHSNRFSHKKTISAAGYETIKLLGQGSFGVVRLVREKGTVNKATISRQKGVLDVDGVRGGIRNDPSLWLMPKSKPPTSKDSIRNDRGQVFAMKIIRKADMVQLCQEGHIRAEREFLASSEQSKWIVPLIASFQDTSHLYLIMEYEVGGDFFSLLLRQGVLSERDTMWYVAEMVLCIEEAHRLGWIHRDVKPENFLISSSGHLKIGDFGLAFDGHWSHNQEYFHNHRYSLLNKLGIEVEGDAKDQSDEHESVNSSMNYLHPCGNHPSGRRPGERVLDWRDRNEQRRLARSIVGTSQYMAPEIIAGEAYDGRCDYWSLGIILFEECLYGMTPFYRDNRDDTKRCILHHRTTLSFPQERFSDLVISLHAIDLIQQLLQIKEFRLSSKQYKINDCFLWPSLHNAMYPSPVDTLNPYYKGQHVYPNDANDIKTHRFFRDIPWNEMLIHEPPYIPNVTGYEDTKYFEDDYPSSTNPANEPTTGSESESSSSYMKLPTVEDTSSSDSRPATVVCQGTKKKENVKINANNNYSKKKDKNKRPRDKILRDTNIGPTALDVRTKKAFIGYTWRRPTPVRNVLETTRLFTD